MLYKATYLSFSKVKIELPHEPIILFLDIYPQRTENRVSDICSLSVMG